MLVPLTLSSQSYVTFNNNCNLFESSYLILEATSRSAQGSHGTSPSPFDTYDIIYAAFILLNHFYCTLSKYLPKFCTLLLLPLYITL